MDVQQELSQKMVKSLNLRWTFNFVTTYNAFQQHQQLESAMLVTTLQQPHLYGGEEEQYTSMAPGTDCLTALLLYGTVLHWLNILLYSTIQYHCTVPLQQKRIRCHLLFYSLLNDFVLLSES